MTTAMSPPGSPASGLQRPVSMLVQPGKRASSRMSFSSRNGATSKSLDDENKTAVKVAVRVRPPLQSTDPGFHLVPQRFRASTVQCTAPTNLTVESVQGKKLFVFDRVFSEDVDQDGVWEYLSDSVNSFLQGYNVSIMAYGQSGAGKSYTMGTSGPSEQTDIQTMGIVPRAAASLFDRLNGSPSRSSIRSPTRYSVNGLGALQQAQRGKNWQLTATYVEIYQEHLRDLLIDENTPFTERPQVLIREDPKGRILLTGLRQIPINSIEDLMKALDFGSAIRQTDATAINARSSRSHAVFSLNLVQKKSQPTSIKDKRRSMPLEAMSGTTENWVTLESKLHFVDLAGSERLKNTGAQGERAKEGISINAGLASLGKVIAQLSSRQFGAHVSYRDSKLTRLLQDSLGGNAITYMIACVNPAEFHLSETLNTVQYAQRARAIQSQPQIQQSSDEGDKQALIERLKAEISFLRDQIRIAQSAERTSAPTKVERSQSKEMELQNRLLDVQENYNALSQRHAKLIADMANAPKTDDAETPALDAALGESAAERLDRSHSFAQAVEQVVLEYEKTIQSLETSLSNTRAGLSTSESALLEKETRVAYMETLNTQLQTRLQKAMDREASDETYLADLESRVAGASNGEEKSNAVIASLRKELTRARETEASCEDYISTLEERLAEAEQDHDLMQREVQRLEQMVERQRTLGRLDNLLQDLDGVRHTEQQADAGAMTNGHHTDLDEKRPESPTRGREMVNGDTPTELVNGTSAEHHHKDVDAAESMDDDSKTEVFPALTATKPKQNLEVHETDQPTSPAQSKFMEDKLETVTSELFDLKVEHESTLTEYDELQAKYQVALQALAQMQDDVEAARRNRNSVILPATSTKPQQERSLSAELERIGEQEDPLIAEAAAVQAPEPLAVDIPTQREELLLQEIEQLKEHHVEKDAYIAELSQNHASLNDKHQDTLDYVEELRTEVSRMQMSGRSSPTPQIIRRKSSQPLPSDRATRSFAALRNMALESFENEPDKIQSFELNLNAALSEMHMRAERVTSLEAEVASLRKEMDTKMALITGLTRERSSLKATSPLDVSALSSMQSQLIESENRLRQLSETHAARERELLEEIDMLRESPSTPTASRPISVVDMPGAFLETPAIEGGRAKQLGYDEQMEEEHVRQLQQEASTWRFKHDAIVQSTKASEAQLLATIAGLEAALQNAHTTRETARDYEDSPTLATSGADLQLERAQHQATIDALHHEIDELRVTAVANSRQLAEMQDAHTNIMRQVEDDSASRSLTERELTTHRDLVTNLDNQLQEHKRVIETHQQALSSLQDSHAEEIHSLTSVTQVHLEDLQKALEERDQQMTDLRSQLEQSQTEGAQHSAQLKELLEGSTMILGTQVDARSLPQQLQSSMNARRDISALHETATNELQDTRQQLEAARLQQNDLSAKLDQMKSINDETLRELQRVSDKEKKSSKLVEELEEQLNSNFDQHKSTTNRLSALQNERNTQLEESRAKIVGLEAQLAEATRLRQRASLDPRDADQLERSNSVSGNPPATSTPSAVRKSSVSAVSLPSPPPAIPLPPLPNSPMNTLTSPTTIANNISPPTSRHQSKELSAAAATAAQQIAEDQEARIRTIEKHLFAEKQLTATLEEALTDLESSSTKMKGEMEAWRRKCSGLEEELGLMKKQRESSRHSVQQLEEERDKRKQLEAQQARLEARLTALANTSAKKKKNALNCF